MKRLNKVALALATAGLLASGVAQAELFDRGGGLIYDDVLNITWLSDANYAATQFAATGGTQGDLDGLMNWSAANTWASSLNISRFAGESLTDWRLPTALNQNGSGPCLGYNCSNSEMGHMSYNNLYDAGGYGISFTNLQSYVYWSGTTDSPGSVEYAWYYDFSSDRQDYYGTNGVFYAWAVRPGNVALVPEPEAYAMLLAGLGLLGVVAKRRRRSFGAS
mgnify:CR=1 FL=1